ncbi:MAG: hypothetical protein RBG13Loki_0476 [Promethearchaeota archaeon CR_4]|nr:MAG: hypothetical protein RBG13Loki_0476 [Candidatus Lokiarchaeota archaeon CR_4]
MIFCIRDGGHFLTDEFFDLLNFNPNFRFYESLAVFKYFSINNRVGHHILHTCSQFFLIHIQFLREFDDVHDIVLGHVCGRDYFMFDYIHKNLFFELQKFTFKEFTECLEFINRNLAILFKIGIEMFILL